MDRLKNKHKKVYLSFRLGKETFAVSVKKVLEVLQRQHITQVPDVPGYIKGVINFRGDILPICDARIKFNIDTEADQEKHVIIVLDLDDSTQKIRIGAIADGVKDVISIEEADIKPVPEMGLKYNVEYLSGMIRSGDSFIMILNVDKIFTNDEVGLITSSAPDSL
ncbi:MAG TPA: chemotaxis protein CheW [Bacteroidales bacterium]|nr:chemotaxis protein CheW [Bacteroidales bacterium]